MTDTLLAIVPRVRLSAVLTAFHRDGYGHVTRVLDPERAPLPNQLGRAGVQNSRLANTPLTEAVMLFVHAPMRTSAAAALAVAQGAMDIELVPCGDPVSAAVAPGLIAFAEDRRERRLNRPLNTAHAAPAGTSDFPGDPGVPDR
jgi:hypothetical protein